MGFNSEFKGLTAMEQQHKNNSFKSHGLIPRLFRVMSCNLYSSFSVLTTKRKREIW